MIDVAVRLLSAFAEHPEHGINALRLTIPRTNLGGAPDDAEPPAVTIFNDADTKEVAKDLTAPKVPALVFWGDSSADVSLRGYKRAKEVVIAAGFITDAGEDPLVINRACGYILRAGQLTFDRYNSQPLSKQYRELNGVRVLELSSVKEDRITATVGKQKMWGFLAIRAHVVETLS